MKKLILTTIFALLAGIVTAGMVDIELVVIPGGNAQVSATAKGVNGYVDSIALKTASLSTGVVSITLGLADTGITARTLYSVSITNANAWSDPSDSASRRYAITDKDSFTMTATNATGAAKEYKAVIRVETLK